MIKEFIDIYSKLVIGVISFIAPMTSYLLSTYITDRRKIFNKLSDQEKNLDKIIEDDFKAAKDGQVTGKDFIKQSQKKLKMTEKEIKLKLDLLNFLQPKKCITRMFSILFLSIGLLLFDVVVRENVFNLYNHKLSVGLLSGSILLFATAILYLGQIALKLVDAKELLEEERQEITREKEFVNVESEK
jgi:ABC-type multidrug transport system fused ATPase/permease subunit